MKHYAHLKPAMTMLKACFSVLLKSIPKTRLPAWLTTRSGARIPNRKKYAADALTWFNKVKSR